MQSSMLALKFKDFLRSGAILQRAPDVFNLFIGPFSSVRLTAQELNQASDLLFQPDFWDFLEKSDDQYHFLKPEQTLVLSKKQFIEILNQLEAQPVSVQWNQVEDLEFKKQFQWSQEKFAENKLIKTVPILFVEGQAQFNEQNLVYILKKLLADDNYGWTYGLWNQGKGYLGHTPELLCDWSSKTETLRTFALAGTYLKSENAHIEILKDKKILNEHQIVIDDISEKLKNLKATQSATEALQLKHLVHLQTGFKVQVKTLQQAFEIMNELHPTAALGLYPNRKDFFIQFKELQTRLDRKNFAAPFAFVNQKEFLAVAAIRNFYFDQKKIQIESGCGVTNLSEYDVELSELKNKRESVMRMMGLNHD